MKRVSSGLWLIFTVVAAITACSDSGDEAVGQIESALSCHVNLVCPGGSVIECSSEAGGCQSDNTGWVECDGVRTFCPPLPPACVCGAARLTKHSIGQAASCGSAIAMARTAVGLAERQSCGSGACNIVEAPFECSPVSSNRSDGFRVNVFQTFSCYGPPGCQ
jgi:hypothetical protein